jgi:tryptophan-rich sensory protein
VPINATLFALALTGAAAAMETLAAGRDVRGRLAEVRQPRGSPPLGVWVAIGALYYVASFIVARRLVAADPLDTARAVALAMLMVLLLGNALWNAAFFRRRDPDLSWKLARAYALVALGLAAALWRADRVSLLVFLPYLLYLVYGTWWVYSVCRLEAARHARTQVRSCSEGR